MANSTLYAVTIDASKPLTKNLALELADPNSPLVGITVPDVVPVEACERVMDKLRSSASKCYSGIAAHSLASPIGDSAWGRRYNGDADEHPNSSKRWQGYFDSISEWDDLRQKAFLPHFGIDPNEIVANVLGNAMGIEVRNAVHPRIGRPLGAGIVRTGAADAHFDWAPDDLGLDAIGHIGVVIPLCTGPSPVQRVWDHFAEADEFGNYDLKVPDDTPFIDIPTPIGSICLLSARRTHAVLDAPIRTTFALHVAILSDGRAVKYA